MSEPTANGRGATSPLEAAFGQADPAHFAWQTEGAYVAAAERELVRAAFLPLGRRVLDLGCGEGATLLHLGAPAGAVGVDLFAAKVAFARERLPGCELVCASATDLPFADARFDHVLVRDLLHHLDDPREALDECARVLERGGRLDVLEPCRTSPLVVAHALVKPEERGELRSTPAFLARCLEPRFRVEAVRKYQAFPIHRVVFHPELGAPRLAERPAARALVAGLERLAARVLPEWAWAYVHLRATKRD
jgi:SAM-dependent methyltransferase